MTFDFSIVTRVSLGKRAKKLDSGDFDAIKKANAGLKAKFREDLDHLLECQPVIAARSAKDELPPLRLVHSRAG